jgi:hypothetical protein
MALQPNVGPSSTSAPTLFYFVRSAEHAGCVLLHSTFPSPGRLPSWATAGELSSQSLFTDSTKGLSLYHVKVMQLLGGELLIYLNIKVIFHVVCTKRVLFSINCKTLQCTAS